MCRHRKWHNHPHTRTLSMYRAGVMSSDTDVSSLFFNKYRWGLKPPMPRATRTLLMFIVQIQYHCVTLISWSNVAVAVYQNVYHSVVTPCSVLNWTFYTEVGVGDWETFISISVIVDSAYQSTFLSNSFINSMDYVSEKHASVDKRKWWCQRIRFKWTEAFDSWFYSIHGSQFPPLHGIYGAFTFSLQLPMVTWKTDMCQRKEKGVVCTSNVMTPVSLSPVYADDLVKIKYVFQNNLWEAHGEAGLCTDTIAMAANHSLCDVNMSIHWMSSGMVLLCRQQPVAPVECKFDRKVTSLNLRWN